MKPEFWNNRYKTLEFAYGKIPNVFYKSVIDKLEPKSILFPLEGEGRNAVYAAELGWKVYAFDMSKEGKSKAEILAKEKNVSIEYTVSNLECIDYKKESFDCIVLIFAHFPVDLRNKYHLKIIEYLKPGGLLILEGYSKEHYAFNSVNKEVGGPDNKDMLFSKEDLLCDFNKLKTLNITKKDYELAEGLYHNGMSSVYQVTGIK